MSDTATEVENTQAETNEEVVAQTVEETAEAAEQEESPQEEAKVQDTSAENPVKGASEVAVDEDDDFGDFGEAPVVSEVQGSAVASEIAQQDDNDGDDDFGDFDEAPSMPAPAPVVQQHEQQPTPAASPAIASNSIDISAGVSVDVVLASVSKLWSNAFSSQVADINNEQVKQRALTLLNTPVSTSSLPSPGPAAVLNASMNTTVPAGGIPLNTVEAVPRRSTYGTTQSNDSKFSSWRGSASESRLLQVLGLLQAAAAAADSVGGSGDMQQSAQSVASAGARTGALFGAPGDSSMYDRLSPSSIDTGLGLAGRRAQQIY